MIAYKIIEHLLRVNAEAELNLLSATGWRLCGVVAQTTGSVWLVLENIQPDKPLYTSAVATPGPAPAHAPSTRVKVKHVRLDKVQDKPQDELPSQPHS